MGWLEHLVVAWGGSTVDERGRWETFVIRGGSYRGKGTLDIGSNMRKTVGNLSKGRNI